MGHNLFFHYYFLGENNYPTLNKKLISLTHRKLRHGKNSFFFEPLIVKLNNNKIGSVAKLKKQKQILINEKEPFRQ
ncbi:hypothetical protein BK742_17630 [Bacillus thuringiensis serovar pingluonsis]|uniref:Uncharacterized protein n=1 Tax=Bacillus thuringiensis serovar pingluonsis TaxID=180881 RepID=A0A243B9Q6_BACTU|nr:hypothetical protein BK742_17630 [Bacillus thuringiensis serovar pingluonsis]